MSNQKKITKESYRELISMKGALFDIYTGELKPLTYELLELKVIYLEREGLDVSEFRDFLKCYRFLYDIRKQDSIKQTDNETPS